MNVNVKLAVRIRQVGRHWVTVCPVIAVATQSRTKAAALKGLREAIELWFESCISRDVLDQALLESGFKKLEQGQSDIQGDNIVMTRSVEKCEPDQGSDHRDTIKFRVLRARGKEFLEGSIPAWIAGDKIESYSSASV